MAARVVPLVALGAWTFGHITAAVGPFMGPIAAECGRRHRGSALAPARTFLCTIVPFFQEGLQGHAGFLVWGTFVSAGQSFLTFAAVESSRLGTGPPLTWLPAFAALFQALAELKELTCLQRRLHVSQVFGVSVILPLLWLPAYFLSGAADQRKAAPASRAVSVQRIVAIAFVMYVQTIFCVCLMLPFETDLLKKLIAIFQQSASQIPMLTNPRSVQIIPVVAPFFWLPAAVTERSTKNKDRGHSAILALHLVQAGAALAWHVVAVPYAGLLHPSALSEVYNLFHSHEGGSACKYFLLVDLLVFIGANFYQVLLEHGILALLAVAAGTVLAGPGAALSLYYAYREAQFLALPADDAKKSD
eukprot:SM000114S24172  [mRNA]  locus=s114:433315:435804:- [translate_table: standard]